MAEEVGTEGARQVRSVPPNVRGARTRRRIAEAALALLEARDSPPTSREIAEHAGVSLRLVFHHYEDLDALYQAASGLATERYAALMPDVPGDLPLHTRIERTVERRAALYEAIGNLGRNSATLAVSHPGVAVALRAARSALAARCERTFAPEIRAAGRRRRELLAGIGIAVSFRTWDRLRRDEGLSVASSRRVVSRLLRAVLADLRPDAPSGA
jgi:AcrR family transcriptional regulator